MIVAVLICESKDLPLTIIGAVLGVAMTVFATYFLFKGQSNQQIELQNIEWEGEKETEIFKQKLTTYNNFLKALCSYVTDSTETNKKALIFYTMAIQMHTDPNTVQSFIDNVSKIIEVTGNGDKKEIEALVITLQKISQIFQNELYGKPEHEDSRIDLTSFIKNIVGGQVEPSEKEKELEIEEDRKEDEASVGNDTLISWEAKVNNLESEGWLFTYGNDSFVMKSDNSPVQISVYRKKGKYVIEATKEGDSDFSQNLKDNFKGSRRYGTWWRELPISNYGVKDGTLLEQLPTNDKARASVMKWIDKITEYIK
ncbi:MAG: hypothetical protein K2K93_02445 [Muribaculaceae bacterium]|nr:hypothetical protein [Muribaculaceae bacterium]